MSITTTINSVRSGGRAARSEVRSTSRLKKRTLALTAVVFGLCATACGSDIADDPAAAPTTIAAGSVNSTSATTAASADPVSTAGTPIKITVGDQTFTAILNDSAVAQDFIATLPVTLPWFRNAGIEYITELSEPMTETGPFYTDVEAGDIVYYNPFDSITIIYAPTSSVPTLTKMGEITSDLSAFENLPDNVDMTIEVST